MGDDGTSNSANREGSGRGGRQAAEEAGDGGRQAAEEEGDSGRQATEEEGDGGNQAAEEGTSGCDWRAAEEAGHDGRRAAEEGGVGGVAMASEEEEEGADDGSVMMMTVMDRLSSEYLIQSGKKNEFEIGHQSINRAKGKIFDRNRIRKGQNSGNFESLSSNHHHKCVRKVENAFLVLNHQ